MKYDASLDPVLTERLGACRDPRSQGALARRPLRVQRERASGYSAASSGSICHRLGTGPLCDACILGVPGILEQQARAARMPAVLNQPGLSRRGAGSSRLL